ncbi:MAG TPA: YdhR family protein [Terracidiphilus sp.]|nr:YdhR family protein [Terracidiphilus sp.]
MEEKTSPGYIVLHLRFNLRVSPDVVLAHSRDAATKVAAVEGLIWKIWLVERDRREMGGLYLFADRESAVGYLNHPIIEALCSNPAVVSMDCQVWNVEESLSALTRGPLADVRVGQQELVMTGGR